MTLQQFIKQTLTEIKGGIADANSDGSPNKDFIIRPNSPTAKDVGMIDFDVAVVASSQTTGKSGGNIDLRIFEVGGDTSTSRTQQNVSRVKFTIQVNQTLV